MGEHSSQRQHPEQADHTPSERSSREAKETILHSPRVAEILFLQRAAGNQAVSQLVQPTAVQRERGGTTIDPANPLERPAVDATGHYESVMGSQRVTLQLNQAGQHLRGWWQVHAGGRDLAYFEIEDGQVTESSYNRTVFTYGRQRMEGRRRVGEEILGSLTATRLRVPGEDGFENVLQVSERVAGGMTFAQITSAPRLSRESIDTMPGQGRVRELIRSAETAPLDHEDRIRVNRAANRIRPAMLAYLGTGQVGPGAVHDAVAIDRLVEEEIGYFGNAQLPIAARTLREYLAGENAVLRSGNATRPIWDWLQVMVTNHPEQRVTGHVQSLLGMTPRGPRGINTPQHHYRYQLTLRGIAGQPGAVGVGAFTGDFWIEEVSPLHWLEQYTCYLGQVSAGPGAGVTFGVDSGWTSFYSPNAWTSGNFRGPIGVLQGSVGLAPGVGRSTGVGTILFEGDGSLPTLHADAGGVQRVLGVTAGAEYSAQGGWLTGGGHVESRRETPAYDPVQGRSSHVVRHEGPAFGVNDPSLNAEGWRDLREMIARHRASFESQASTLTIDGYCSTTGPEARNERLARLRALNVQTAIRDILGPALRIQRRNITTEGHGEAGARAAAVRDGLPANNVEDPHWRRVDVILNGVVVLQLFGYQGQ